MHGVNFFSLSCKHGCLLGDEGKEETTSLRCSATELFFFFLFLLRFFLLFSLASFSSFFFFLLSPPFRQPQNAAKDSRLLSSLNACSIKELKGCVVNVVRGCAYGYVSASNKEKETKQEKKKVKKPFSMPPAGPDMYMYTRHQAVAIRRKQASPTSS